jgi:hypothetical protein
VGGISITRANPRGKLKLEWPGAFADVRRRWP